jgi:hypothetical protein
VIAQSRTDLLGATVVHGPVAGVHSGTWDELAVIGNHTADAVITTRADAHNAMVEVHGVARFHVAERTVTIDVHPGAADEAVRSWLFGTVAALVAGQDGRFALHASVIEIDGVCVAISGMRKAGKSTTTLAATLAGATLVADDVAVLTRDDARLLVHPFGRPVHVWNETAERLGIDVTGAPQVASGFDKVSLPAPVDHSPRPLHGMVVLRPDAVTAAVATAVSGIGRLQAVRNQTYRSHLVGAVWPQEVFQWQAEVARSLEVVRIVRPETWSVDAVVAEVAAFAGRLGS